MAKKNQGRGTAGEACPLSHSLLEPAEKGSSPSGCQPQMRSPCLSHSVICVGGGSTAPISQRQEIQVQPEALLLQTALVAACLSPPALMGEGARNGTDRSGDAGPTRWLTWVA